MWLNEEEFDEMLAKYWEQEEDRAAQKLHSVQDSIGKGRLSLRARLGELVHRLHHGPKILNTPPSTRA